VPTMQWPMLWPIWPWTPSLQPLYGHLQPSTSARRQLLTKLQSYCATDLQPWLLNAADWRPVKVLIPVGTLQKSGLPIWDRLIVVSSKSKTQKLKLELYVQNTQQNARARRFLQAFTETEDRIVARCPRPDHVTYAQPMELVKQPAKQKTQSPYLVT
jgi:hypothetical protein